MTLYEINGTAPAPIPLQSSTALLLIQCQNGWRDTALYGDSPSTPKFEDNIKSLIGKFRSSFDSLPFEQRPTVIHCLHRPVWTDHPLYPTKKGPWGASGEEVRAFDPIDFALPRRVAKDGTVSWVTQFDEPETEEQINAFKKLRELSGPQNESVMTTHGHGAFIHTQLIDAILKPKGIKTLIIVGMGTDHGVSTAVRAAQNMALTGMWGLVGNEEDEDTKNLKTDGVSWMASKKGEDGTEQKTVDMARILVVSDATRSFSRGGIDAETIQKVHIESFKDFVEVWNTEEVLEALK